MSTLDKWKQLLPHYYDYHPHMRGRDMDEYEWLPVKAPIGGDLLDLGTGYGRYISSFRSMGYDVVAADITDALFPMLEVMGAKPLLLDGDGSIPLDSDSMDVVVSMSLMQHLGVDQSLKYLEESRRVLRPEGFMQHQHSTAPVSDKFEPYIVFADLEPALPDWVKVVYDDCDRVFLEYYRD